MKIGFTGHQKLDDNRGWHWVTEVVRKQFEGIHPFTGVTSLAIGADQLFAKLVTEEGGQIFAIIPFDDYERTFDEQGLKTYRKLLGKAVSIEILEGKACDEDSYLAAGKRIVDLSDMIIAVWNGLPAKGKGGTADIVDFALQKQKPLVHINPQNCTVTRYGS